MQLSSLFGLLFAFIVFVGSAMTATDNAKIFFDVHALAIVVGGTFAACLLSFSMPRIIFLFKIFLKKILKGPSDYVPVVNEIIDLAKGYRESDGYLKTKMGSINNPFLKEAIQMVAEGGIDPEDVDEILLKRIRTNFTRFEEDAESFRTLAKFPPAFGLLGAVMGIISLMTNLGGADAFQKVGPAMAVALVATLYGIAIANFIFLPLAENLSRINRRDYMIRQMICEGVKLIRMKKHPFMVEEAVKSYLLANERDLN